MISSPRSVNGLWIINLVFTLTKIRLNLYFLFLNVKKVPQPSITYKSIQTKQHSNVTYLGWTLDETASGESMALKVINETNSRLKFVHMKNKLLATVLRRWLSNVLIQPDFNYASSAWYPNLNQKVKNKIRIVQNKCTGYYLQLDKMNHISKHEF